MVMKKQKYPSSNKRTNVGRLSLFSRTTGFRYICLYVRNESVLYFFKKIEGSQEPSPILDFFQGKKVQFSSLWFSVIQEQLSFLAVLHKPDLRNFNILFGNLSFTLLFFYQKWTLNIFQ